MSTRATIRTEVKNRLGDPTNAIWSDAELNGYIDQAIKSVYPTFYILQSGTTTAGAGPIQTAPNANVRDIYAIGVMAAGAARVRIIRQWREGFNGTAMIPNTNINGQTLVWSWTSPFSSPADDVTTLDLHVEAEEVVVLRTVITALEHILSNRTKQNIYFTLTVREGTTEQDLVQTLDALHASVDQRVKAAIPRPQRVG